jgi:hypothetical protein
MTEHISHGRIKETARLFHQTCPGDWGRHPTCLSVARYECTTTLASSKTRLRSWLRQFGFDGRQPFWRTTSLARSDCRCRMMRFAFCRTDTHGSKRPRPPFPIDRIASTNKYFYVIRDGGFELSPLPDQGPRFLRHTSYPSASLLDLEATKEVKMARISDILAFLEQVKQPNAQEVCQNAGVSQSYGRLAPILRETCSKVGVASRGCSCTVGMMAGTIRWGLAFCYLFFY